MNLHHLLIFQAIAETGSMTAASEKLLISQPAVSSQLRLLELALDSPLFERRPRGMTLTAAGEVLTSYAARIFSLAEDAAAAVADLQSLKRGRLRVGASPTIAVYFLPPLLVHFQRRFPQVQLQVEVEDHHVLEQRLEDGLLDIGLSPVAASMPDFHSIPFMEEDFVPVAAPTHPLCHERTVHAEQLAAAFVSRQLPSATGSLTCAYFVRCHISIKPILSLGSVEAVKQAVVAGLGATIMSKMAIESEIRSRRLRILKVSGLPLRRPLFQMQHGLTESKTATAFACLLKHAVRGTLPKLKT